MYTMQEKKMTMASASKTGNSLPTVPIVHVYCIRANDNFVGKKKKIFFLSGLELEFMVRILDRVFDFGVRCAARSVSQKLTSFRSL